MNSDALGYLVGAVVVLLTTVYTARSTRRANQAVLAAKQQLTRVRVDGEAYDRAQAINQQIVEDLRAEVNRLQRELEALRNQLRAENQHSAQLEDKVRTLQNTVDRLSNLLMQHNITIPSGGTA